LKLRLLLIDDDVRLARAMARGISVESSWEFHACTDPDKGLERIQELKPDVELLDYDLGDEAPTGFEILRRLRANSQLRHMPVLILTGRLPEVGDRIEGLELGADDYLIKPIGIPLLLARAKAAVDKAQRGYRRA
jgi:DNA-binding response OmpR family regulator